MSEPRQPADDEAGRSTEPAETAGPETPVPVAHREAVARESQSPPPAPPGAGDSTDGLEPKDPEAQLGGRMTFLEHLDELRRRILHGALALVIAFPVCWIFREQIYGFIAQPIHEVMGDDLYITKPTEAFTIYLKVSFIGAIFLAIPYILLQTWLFIAPGLYRKEKAWALPFLLSSTMLFLIGGAFGYWMILPPALRFLLVDLGARFNKIITAVHFFDFALVIIVGMGVIFQMPILVAFLSLFDLVTPGFMWRNFRYAFLLMLIVAAVVSPTTDVVNLFLWCGPMVALYVASIGVSWIFQRRRQRRQ